MCQSTDLHELVSAFKDIFHIFETFLHEKISCMIRVDTELLFKAPTSLKSLEARLLMSFKKNALLS